MSRTIGAVCLAVVLAGALSHAHVLASEAQSDPTVQYGVGPLHTTGSKLLDANGLEVRITGVNWFGLETDTYAPHGLWARNYGEMLDQMVAAGFNTPRLPDRNQLSESASVPSGIDYQKNPDLKDLSGIQVLDAIIDAAGARGL